MFCNQYFRKALSFTKEDQKKKRMLSELLLTLYLQIMRLTLYQLS